MGIVVGYWYGRGQYSTFFKLKVDARKKQSDDSDRGLQDGDAITGTRSVFGDGSRLRLEERREAVA
jgi:hypothetical protein